jgi:Protein of unknown function (DUF3631)
MDKKTLKRIRDLHARVVGGSTPQEREAAWKKLDARLRKHGKTWNDLPELLHQEPGAGPPPDPRDDVSAGANPNTRALDVVHRFLEQYVDMKPHEYVAVSLWALHTFVFDTFQVTPRLALISPVRGCGKTVVLDVLSSLVPRPHKTDHASAAAVYSRAHLRDTLLIDEADNLGLADNQALKSTLNSGHRKGGRVTRMGKTYSTFTPMAIAAIGALPLPTMHRSVVIQMTRATRKLRRYEESDLQDLHIAYSMSRDWARSVRLNPDPELPEVLRNRPADNWRPLISIADAFGPAWGDKAREAAIEFSKGYLDEDLAIVLLKDIRKAFPEVPYYPSAYLVAALAASEDTCGANGAVFTATGLRASSRKANSPSCSGHFALNRERSGGPIAREDH